MCHLIRDNEIRCNKPAVFLCFIYDTDIDFLSNLFIIGWNICIRLHETSLSCPVAGRCKVFLNIHIIRILVTHGVPHLQKRHGQRFYRISFQTDTCILPHTVWLGHIKILICEIIPSGKSYLTVNHRNLTMIPVI